ncbi:heterokaryon incompatibility protein-domain-containing protein [Chaetomium sp. MPI-CAGE-AT-0009]|nr:heterokaryon incompatibility protein-domain-containing protein [Chaetomium sp. MPI-CAGE-AT-0009]
MICTRCRDAFQYIVSNDDTWTTGSKSVEQKQTNDDETRDQKERHWFKHHPTYESFREAIDQRCSVCIVLWELLEPEQQSLLTASPEKVQAGTKVHSAKRKTHLVEYMLNINFHCIVSGSPHVSFFSHGCFILEPINSTSKHPVVLSDHTRSPETLALAKRWVTRCTKYHQKCKAALGNGTWYPSRVLDLTHVDATEPQLEQRVYLLETAKATPTGRYTTLSHRWGPTEQFRLAQHTYPQLIEGVPLGSLPRLIQDAIFVSLELGIRYIWIDLLCIYQDEDNIADWQHESTLMNQVYSNTFCNISAGDANGCLESMFAFRDTDIFLPQTLELKIGPHDDGDDSGDSGGSHGTQLFRVYDDDYWYRSISSALVNTRAWVLQERVLSPRVLQFDRRQVLWECLEKSATETCPSRIPGQLVGVGHRIFKNRFPTLPQQTTTIGGTPNNGELAVDVLHTWTCLVKEYTTCGLTVPSDKLIAISGVAKHLAGLAQCDYVAGLWRSHLEGELLWFVQHSGLPGKTSRPAQYRAPSWSWASIEGAVEPGFSSMHGLLIRVEDVHLEYLTDDVFGAVTRGRLRLRGPLRQFQVVCNNLRGTWGERGWDMSFDGDVKVTAPEISKGSGISYPTRPDFRLDVFQDSFEEENASDMLFAMLGRKITVSPRGIKDTRLEMLLLKLVDREKAVFERIGYAKVGNSDAEAVLAIQRPADAPSLPCLEYQDGMYSIDII